MSPGTRRRIGRIRKRGSPELIKAFDRGLISAGAAESLLRLSQADQIAELERRQAAEERQEYRSRRAAQLINEYLDHYAPRIDLAELRRLLTEELGERKALACRTES